MGGRENLAGANNCCVFRVPIALVESLMMASCYAFEGSLGVIYIESRDVVG